MGTMDISLKQKAGNRWWRGFWQILKGELSRWFGTRRWIVQIVIYGLLIIPTVLLILDKPDTRIVGDGQIITVNHRAEGIEFFNAVQGIVGVVGVTILMEGAILGEKRSGVSAWMLSKPVSRSAYLVAKLVGNSIGVFVCIILSQGAIAFMIFNNKLAQPPNLGTMVIAMLPQMINLFFYLSLTTMLASIFNHRGIVIAIPILPLFTDELLVASITPETLTILSKILPFGLTTGYNEQFPAIAKSIMMGTQPYSLEPLYWISVISFLFIGIALYAFHKLQL